MKPFAPALFVALVVALVACSDGEDAQVASAKYAATLCTKLDECNVPRDDPNETSETCRTRLENATSTKDSTKSACSKEENDKCRAAIAAQECTTFVLDTVLGKKLPPECEGC